MRPERRARLGHVGFELQGQRGGQPQKGVTGQLKFSTEHPGNRVKAEPTG